MNPNARGPVVSDLYVKSNLGILRFTDIPEITFTKLREWRTQLKFETEIISRDLEEKSREAIENKERIPGNWLKSTSYALNVKRRFYELVEEEMKLRTDDVTPADKREPKVYERFYKSAKDLLDPQTFTNLEREANNY